MKKRILVLLLAFTMIFASAVTSFADPGLEMQQQQPQQEFSTFSSKYGAYFISYYEIMNGYFNGYTIYKANRADKMKVVAYLQEYKSSGWKNIDSFYGYKDGPGCVVVTKKRAEYGKTYRLKVYGYIYIRGVLAETTRMTGREVTYE